MMADFRKVSNWLTHFPYGFISILLFDTFDILQTLCKMTRVFFIKILVFLITLSNIAFTISNINVTKHFN